MRPKISRFAVPIALFVVGILLLAWSVLENKGQIHWVFIIPVFTSTSIFAFLGTILIIIAIFLFFFYYLRGFAPLYAEGAPARERLEEAPQAPRADKKFGGVVLIGPVPVIFGSDPKTTIIIIVLAIILIIAAILFIVFFWKP